MQQPNQHEQSLSLNEMTLRNHLLAARVADGSHAQTPQHEQMQSHGPMGHPQHHIDASVRSSQYMMGSDLSSDLDDGKRAGKNRELSNSKRAAQNRAAQRAFRQRKEGYIKKLEEQVRAFNGLEESYKHLQSDYFELRAYILQLQTQLLEARGSYPSPPSSMSNDIQRTSTVAPPQQQQQQVQMEQEHDSATEQRHMLSVRAAAIEAPDDHRAQEQDPPLYDANSDAQMSPMAVDQLQAAAAAAQAGAYVADEEIKQDDLPTDEETLAIEEAARAAAYAAVKTGEEEGGDEDDVTSTRDSGVLPDQV